MKRTLATLMLALAMVGVAAGQGNVLMQATADVSNIVGAGKQTTVQFFNQVGSANVAIEFKFSGAPATTSIPIMGCMRGGTCNTLGTIVTGSNQIFFVGGVYDYVQMTPVFTGGTNPFVTINYTGISQSSGGGSGIGATNTQGAVLGGTSGVGINPVMVGGCVTVTSGACNGNVIAARFDASGNLITVGAGAASGIAQANPVYSLPNGGSVGTCCAATPIVIASVTTATNIKASGGALFWVQGTNTNASVCYLQLFDVLSGSVTLGTTAPKVVVSLGAAVGASGTATLTPLGLYFSSTGLSVAATTTPTGAATCATGVVVSAIAT